MIDETPVLTIGLGWLAILGSPLFLAGVFLAGRWKTGARWRLLVAAGVAAAAFAGGSTLDFGLGGGVPAYRRWVVPKVWGAELLERQVEVTDSWIGRAELVARIRLRRQ